MVTIRHMVLGEGRPKICVPLVSSDFPELEEECASLAGAPLDMLEWRVDYLLNRKDFRATVDLERAYTIIRRYFKDTPLLTTVRTKSQGGAHKTPGAEYIDLVSLILSSHWADMIDVEYGHDMMDTKVLMARARAKTIPVLMSYHKFKRALSEMEIVDALENMKSFRPDALKIAVMPEKTADVAALISGAARVGQNFPEMPIIAIGMGPLGVLTRVAGNHLGAPLTFAAGREASAPGQLTVEDAGRVLDILYKE